MVAEDCYKVDKIILVTPLKDEMTNISKLIESISSQNLSIYCWIIVENGSKDGSKEFLDSIQRVENVKNFFVLNFTLPNDEYQLGFKYSTVVNEGFKYAVRLIKESKLERPEFIGICDADCFPQSDYYEKLTSFMNTKGVDISSGIGRFHNGKSDGEASEWVRGNCRLWNYLCFEDCGYYIGPSADALSLGKAELKGYTAYPNPKITYICREMGSRTRYSYYGYSSYYRGISPFYAILKFFNYIFVGQHKQGVQYLNGYFTSYIKRKERLQDLDLRQYFSNSLVRKLKK